MTREVVRSPNPGSPTLHSTASSQPVDLLSPHYHVELRVAGGAWTDITDRVEDVIHIDRGGGGETSRVELPISNAEDWAMRQTDLMRNGARFHVEYGYPGRIRDAGEFVGKEQKTNSKQVTVTAHERKRARRSRKPESKTWHNRTRSEVAREVLSGHGIDQNDLHITETSTRLPSITRVKEHSWEFADYLARLEGFELWADEGGIYWMEPARSAAPSHLLRYVRGEVGIGIIKDFSSDSFSAGVPGRVKLYGRDPRTQRVYTVEGSDTSTKDLVELVDSDDIRTLEDGDRYDEEDTGYQIEKNVGSRPREEAQALADSMYKDYKYNALKLELPVFLDPSIRTFTNVLVWGLGPLFDGIYSCRNATHRVKTVESTLSLRRAGKKTGNGSDSAIDNALRQLLGESSKIKPLKGLLNFIK